MITQICGLPRSRTAWLATFLSLNPRAIVHHELAATDVRWRATIDETVRTLPHSKTHRHLVDVSTYGQYPAAYIQGSRFIWLAQDPEESRKRSMAAVGYDPGPLEELEKRGLGRYLALQLAGTDCGRTWEVKDLFKPGVLAWIWAFCFPPEDGTAGPLPTIEPFPYELVNFFRAMKIERMHPAETFSREVGERLAAQLLGGDDD